MIRNIFSTLVWQQPSFSAILPPVTGGVEFRVSIVCSPIPSTNRDLCPCLLIKFWGGTLSVEPALYVSLILSFLLHSHCCHPKMLITSSVRLDLNVDTIWARASGFPLAGLFLPLIWESSSYRWAQEPRVASQHEALLLGLQGASW